MGAACGRRVWARFVGGEYRWGVKPNPADPYAYAYTFACPCPTNDENQGRGTRKRTRTGFQISVIVQVNSVLVGTGMCMRR